MDMCKTAKEMSPETVGELVIHSGNEDSYPVQEHTNASTDQK